MTDPMFNQYVEVMALLAMQREGLSPLPNPWKVIIYTFTARIPREPGLVFLAPLTG